MWHSAVAQSLVTTRLATRAISAETYAATFNPASVTHAKTLVILMVAIFSVAGMALYWRHRRHCASHLVFALHVCAFWLLFICGSLMLTNLALRLLRNIRVFPSARRRDAGWGGLQPRGHDRLLLPRRAGGVFTGESAWITFAKAATLGVALQFTLQAYRFVLFFITFWST